MVTIKDVAARAGVPEKTAMRALSGMTMGKRRDARERLERVMKAAAELGYQPSEIAKALRKGRTRTIGLLVGSITNRYFASLAETVMDEAEQHGYRMILELTRWNVEKSILPGTSSTFQSRRNLLRFRTLPGRTSLPGKAPQRGTSDNHALPQRLRNRFRRQGSFRLASARGSKSRRKRRQQCNTFRMGQPDAAG